MLTFVNTVKGFPRIQDKWFVVVVRNWSGFKSVLVRVMIRALHSSNTEVLQTVCVNTSSMRTKYNNS